MTRQLLGVYPQLLNGGRFPMGGAQQGGADPVSSRACGRYGTTGSSTLLAVAPPR